MNSVEATQFVNKLMTQLWSNPEPEKVDAFYHADITGYFGNQQIGIEDIKNRTRYCQAHFSSIQNEILDVIAENEQIAVRLKQTTIAKDSKESNTHYPIAIYRLRDNKVSHLWFLTDQPFDYKEKA